MTTDPRQCQLCRIAYDAEGKAKNFIVAQHLAETPSGQRECRVMMGINVNPPREARAA